MGCDVEFDPRHAWAVVTHVKVVWSMARCFQFHKPKCVQNVVSFRQFFAARNKDVDVLRCVDFVNTS